MVPISEGNVGVVASAEDDDELELVEVVVPEAGVADCRPRNLPPTQLGQTTQKRNEETRPHQSVAAEASSAVARERAFPR